MAPGQATPFWGLVLHPQELGLPSKTGQYNDSLPLDLQRAPWLPPLLADLQEKVSGEDSLLGLNSQEFARLFHLAAKDAGVLTLGVVPYRRGRWQSDKPLNRYTKGGRLQEQLNKLPAEVRRHCEACHVHIGKILGGQCAPLRPCGAKV